MLVFAGGTPQIEATSHGYLTIMDGKSTQMLTFDSPVLGLECLCLQLFKNGTWIATYVLLCCL